MWTTLLGMLISTGHVPTVKYFVDLFDQFVLPPSQVSVISDVYVELLTGQKKKKEEGEEKKKDDSLKSLLLSAEDALATGVNSLPSGLHGHVFSAVARSHSLFKEGEEEDKKKHKELSFKRRVALLAIYHCSSPKLQPVDLIQALSSFFSFSSVDQFDMGFRVLLEPDERIGVKVQEIYYIPVNLASLSTIGGAARMWRSISAPAESDPSKIVWDVYVVPRVDRMLEEAFLEYGLSYIVDTTGTKNTTGLLAEIREFFKLRDSKMGPQTSKKIIESIESRSSFWEGQKEEMIEWLKNCDKN